MSETSEKSGKKRNPLKKVLVGIGIFLLVAAVGAGAMLLITEGQRKEDKNLAIADVDFSKVPNGTYRGSYEGWNKFDVDPLGSNRMAHNSLEYRYRYFEVFYDTGAAWNQGRAATVRHSLGVGLRKDGFALAVAFPVKEGRVEPMFMVGMNY